MKISKIGPVVFIVFLFFSCQREDIIKTEPAGYKPVEIKYLLRSTISGYIYDQFGQPVAKAKVKIGTDSLYADDNGYFEFSNRLFNKKGELLQVKSENHFVQYGLLKLKLQKPVRINIILQKKSGGIFINPKIKNKKYFYDSWISCEIPANNFILSEEGSEYNKKVKIFLNSPYLENINQFQNPLYGMPLSRTGILDDGKETQVMPVFSMLAAFETMDGKPLDIKQNIHIKALAGAVFFNPDDKLYLWKFMPAKGVWKASKPVTYNATYNSFDFDIDSSGYYAVAKYNVDAVNVQGSVKFNEGSPATYTPFEIINLNTNLNVTNIIYTDFYGDFSVTLEKEVPYLMRFYGCDNMFYDYLLGQIDNPEIGTIVLPFNFNNISSLHLENIYNENGTPVQKGFAELLNFNYSSYYPVFADSGGTDINIHECDPVMVLYDLDNIPQIKHSAEIYLNQVPVFNPHNYPALYEDKDYIYAEIKGWKTFFDSRPCMMECTDNNKTIIFDSRNIMNICFEEDKNQGNYKGEIFFFKFIGQNLISYHNSEKRPVEFDVVKEGSIITASFSDSLYNDVGDVVAIEGYFKIDLR